MDLHRIAKVLAVIWIGYCGWMGAFYIFTLKIMLSAPGAVNKDFTIPKVLANILFFQISGTTIYTWAFDSPANIPRNVRRMLLMWAEYLLPYVAARLFSQRGRS